MSEQNEIFQLISSLSAAEKAYFKRFAYTYRSRENKEYPELFDIIASQKKYNESQIKLKLKGSKLLNNFSASKRHLTDIILNIIKCLMGGNCIHNAVKMSAKVSVNGIGIFHFHFSVCRPCQCRRWVTCSRVPMLNRCAIQSTVMVGTSRNRCARSNSPTGPVNSYCLVVTRWLCPP